MATPTKRAMAAETRAAGDEEGDGEGDNRDAVDGTLGRAAFAALSSPEVLSILGRWSTMVAATSAAATDLRPE